jgi:twitching motility protein PilT
VDFGYVTANNVRLRINVFRQRSTTALSARIVPKDIMPIEKLGFPGFVRNTLLNVKDGLILVTGPTNSGKSTSIASFIYHLAQKRSIHVMTIEDPIEFNFPNVKQSIINQREVGRDAHSFAEALTGVLRQDPDVIVIGEMRDPITVETALRAAETGHLVISTLHTSNAVQSVSRIVNMFEGHAREQIRHILASVFRGVVSQSLLPTPDGKGRVMVYEILSPIDSIKNLIRENKMVQMNSIMQSAEKQGCILMEKTIQDFVKRGKIKTKDIPHGLIRHSIDSKFE